MLRYLLEEKGMQPKDLSAILPKSWVSEILNGKRGISKRDNWRNCFTFRWICFCEGRRVATTTCSLALTCDRAAGGLD
jgi:hypothetical protein